VITQIEERKQGIQVAPNETFSVQQQLSLERQLPFEKDVSNKRKQSVPKQSAQKSFKKAERISIERSSPPSFVQEVNIEIPCHSIYILFKYSYC
jgi:hypothetical protein